MANHKSAFKRMRQTAKRTARNRAAKSQLRTKLKRYRAALASHEGAPPEDLVRSTVGLVDRSVRKGVLHRNKGNRLKSSIMIAANKAAQSAGKPAKA